MTSPPPPAPPGGNLFADLATGPEEVVTDLLSRAGVRIERILSSGQATPEGSWYDQDEDEWVTVLRGRAGLEIEGRGEVIEMAPGDWIDLPAHCRHRVAWTASDEPTVWLAVFFQPETSSQST